MKDIHTHFDEWIAAALIHDLTPEEQAIFDRHLEQNAEARAQYHETKAMSTLLENTLSPQRPSPNFESRMVSGFREKVDGARQSWTELAVFWLRRPVLYLPASAAVLIGLVMLGASMTVDERRQAQAKKDAQTIANAVNGYVTEYGRMPVGSSLGLTGENTFTGGFNVSHKGGDGIVASTSEQPVFSQRQLSGSGPIQDGQTLAMGGQIQNESRAQDKVPILGDIPMAGRLFAEGNTSPATRGNGQQPNSSVASGPVTAGNRTASTAISANAIDQLVSGKPAEQIIATAASPAMVAQNNVMLNYRAAGGKDMELAANKEQKAQLEELKSDAAKKDERWGLEKSEKPAQPVADPTVIDNRKLVRNASLDLEVKNYDSSLDSITAIAAGNSGYVATKNSARLANGKMSGTIVLKVLPDRLDAALLQIRGLGELKNQSLSTRDVTKEYFDTDARLRNARKMEDRLLDLLGTMKGKISELLQVEKELARVREQIEQMQGELKVYDSLVQYATITISLREKDLNEAAAYLLKENVNLSLFAGDVEKTYEAARREADGGKAQILQSRVVKEDSGRVTAVMDLLIAPEDADGLISRIKGLGRVQNYNKQDERVAQDGSVNLNTSKIERDKVRLSLSVLPDDESRKEIRLVVQTKKVESAFEEAKTAASAQGATVVTSGLSVANGANGKSANLTVRTPGKNQADLLEAFKKLGLVSQFTVQRDDAGHADPNEPVLITLALTNASQPVQVTRGAILTPQVEQQAAHLKQAATAAQGETVTSTFERLPDGTQIANLVFRLPLDKYAAFFEEASRSGKMKDFTVQRQDRAEENPELATAEVVLRLYSQGPVVAESNGLMATLRHTLGQGTGALMWSVRMIGVAVAFLAPWVLAVTVAAWIILRIARARKARASR